MSEQLVDDDQTPPQRQRVAAYAVLVRGTGAGREVLLHFQPNVSLLEIE